MSEWIKIIISGLLGTIIGAMISLFTAWYDQKFQLTRRNQEWKKEAYVNFWKKFNKYFEIINTPSKANIALSGKWDIIEEQIQNLCEEMDFYCSEKLKKKLKKFLVKFYNFNNFAIQYICNETVKPENWEDKKKKVYEEYLNFRTSLKKDLFSF